MSFGRDVCRALLRRCAAEACTTSSCCRTLRYSSARSMSKSWGGKTERGHGEGAAWGQLSSSSRDVWTGFVVYLLQLPEEATHDKFLDGIGHLEEEPLQGHQHVI